MNNKGTIKLLLVTLIIFISMGLLYTAITTLGNEGKETVKQEDPFIDDEKDIVLITPPAQSATTPNAPSTTTPSVTSTTNATRTTTPRVTNITKPNVSKPVPTTPKEDEEPVAPETSVPQKPVEYKVSFLDFDGRKISEVTVESGAAAKAPANPKKEGHTFTSWDNTFSKVTSNLKVSAQYKVNLYKVTFVANNGSSDQVNVKYGNNIIKLKDPTKANYTFAGWYKDNALIKSWDFSKETMPSKGITLYARWNENNVSAITVIGEDTFVNGQTLQLDVNVRPGTATNKTVSWIVVSGPATISKTGLLEATGIGTALVKAVAKDGSLKEGTKEITITPSETEILVTAKGDTKEVADSLLMGLIQADYTTASWTILIDSIATDKSTIDGKSKLSEVKGYTLTGVAAKTALVTLVAELAQAKSDAKATADDLLSGLTKADYTRASWIVLTDSIANDKSTIDGKSKLSEVTGYTLTGAAAKTALVPLVAELAQAKTAAKAAADGLLTGLTETDFTRASWKTLTDAVAADKSAIDEKTILSEVTDYTLTGTFAKTALVTLAYELAQVKTVAKATADDLLVGLLEADFTVGSWTILTDAIAADKSAIDGKSKLSEVTGYTLTGTAAKTALVTLAHELAQAKTAAKGAADDLLVGLIEVDFTVGSWTILTDAIATDKSAIDEKTILSEVTGYTLTGTFAKTALVTLAHELAQAKTAAKAAADDLLVGLIEADYTVASWTILTDAVAADKSAIDEKTILSEVTSYTLTGSAAKTELLTLIAELAKAKSKAKDDLNTVLGEYKQADYTVGNWIILTTSKTNGDTAINGSTDLVGVGAAKILAINAMNFVKTIAETTAEAEAIAVQAINNANEKNMEEVITANATILGLNLTNYNALSNNGPVITAMVALTGADKTTIVSKFNEAVAEAKAAYADLLKAWDVLNVFWDDSSPSKQMKPLQGTDTNVLLIVQPIVNTAAKGVTVKVGFSGNGNVSLGGNITYSSKIVIGNVQFQLEKAGQMVIKQIAIVVPAK